MNHQTKVNQSTISPTDSDCSYEMNKNITSNIITGNKSTFYGDGSQLSNSSSLDNRMTILNNHSNLSGRFNSIASNNQMSLPHNSQSDIVAQNNQLHMNHSNVIPQFNGQSNFIAPFNNQSNLIGYAPNVDQNILYHCELLMRRHNIIRDEDDQYTDMAIERILDRKIESEELSADLIEKAQSTKYLKRIMQILHRDIHNLTTEEVQFLNLFHKSLSNKKSFLKDRKLMMNSWH